MKEMNDLNEKIMSLEKALLKRKLEELEMQRSLELAKLNEKGKLDSKNKDFSNDEKREAFIMENFEEFRTKTKEQRDFQYETKVMEIELRFKIRELQIMLKN
jgi:hypothetical protein